MEFNMDEKTRADNRLRQQRYRELHREEINEKRRERYEERKSNNRCPRCGGKVKKGYTLCTDCCEYQGSLNKKYAKKRTAGSKTVKKAAAKKTAVKKTVAKKASKPAKKPVKKTAKRK
jgi:PHP family Zn ribbon phosphoesterase